MSDEPRSQLFRSIEEANSKYTYFLLAAAGAAIGFAITQTKDATITIWMIPLGLAVFSWAASFYTGCKHLQERQSGFVENYQFLRLKDGDHSEFPPYPQLVAAIRHDMEQRFRATGRWGAWQLRFLIAGAVLYVIWHVLEMYLRTFSMAVPFFLV